MALLGQPAEQANGRTVIDTDVLRAAGVTDLSQYGGSVATDIFVD